METAMALVLTEIKSQPSLSFKWRITDILSDKGLIGSKQTKGQGTLRADHIIVIKCGDILLYIIIEMDGIQHFKAVNVNRYMDADAHLMHTRERDARKDAWVSARHSYRLLRISYSVGQSMYNSIVRDAIDAWMSDLTVVNIVRIGEEYK